jgi:hypothetical protein
MQATDLNSIRLFLKDNPESSAILIIDPSMSYETKEFTIYDTLCYINIGQDVVVINPEQIHHVIIKNYTHNNQMGFNQ